MNREYKLICLDLDGTLFNSHHRISKKTIQLLRRLQKSGIDICLATGRGKYDVLLHAEAIDSDVYYIASNGSVVGRCKDESFLFEDGFSPSDILTFLEACDKLGSNPVFMSLDASIISSYRDYFWHNMYSSMINYRLLKHTVFIPNRYKLKDYLMDKNNYVQKGLLFVKGKPVEQVLELLDQFEVAVAPGGQWFEVTKKGVNKSSGIQKLIRHLGIGSDRVLAFGDSQNDIKMLEYVGCGIAMKNAAPEVKQKADDVTDYTNSEDGVYHKLVEIFG